MRTNAFTGTYEDDGEKFFGCSMWLVSPGDIWRWRAACEALRELQREKA